jgi:hypothetical protein
MQYPGSPPNSSTSGGIVVEDASFDLDNTLKAVSYFRFSIGIPLSEVVTIRRQIYSIYYSRCIEKKTQTISVS